MLSSETEKKVNPILFPNKLESLREKKKKIIVKTNINRLSTRPEPLRPKPKNICPILYFTSLLF